MILVGICILQMLSVTELHAFAELFRLCLDFELRKSGSNLH